MPLKLSRSNVSPLGQVQELGKPSQGYLGPSELNGVKVSPFSQVHSEGLIPAPHGDLESIFSLTFSFISLNFPHSSWEDPSGHSQDWGHPAEHFPSSPLHNNNQHQHIPIPCRMGGGSLWSLIHCLKTFGWIEIFVTWAWKAFCLKIVLQL